MLTTLSRGSSRVRHSYICISCLRNAASTRHTLSPYPTLLTRLSPSQFSTTSLNRQPAEEAKESESRNTIDGSNESKDGTAASAEADTSVASPQNDQLPAATTYTESALKSLRKQLGFLGSVIGTESTKTSASAEDNSPGPEQTKPIVAETTGGPHEAEPEVMPAPRRHSIRSTRRKSSIKRRKASLKPKGKESTQEVLQKQSNFLNSLTSSNIPASNSAESTQSHETDTLSATNTVADVQTLRKQLETLARPSADQDTKSHPAGEKGKKKSKEKGEKGDKVIAAPLIRNAGYLPRLSPRTYAQSKYLQQIAPEATKAPPAVVENTSSKPTVKSGTATVHKNTSSKTMKPNLKSENVMVNPWTAFIQAQLKLQANHTKSLGKDADVNSVKKSTAATPAAMLQEGTSAEDEKNPRLSMKARRSRVGLIATEPLTPEKRLRPSKGISLKSRKPNPEPLTPDKNRRLSKGIALKSRTPYPRPVEQGQANDAPVERRKAKAAPIDLQATTDLESAAFAKIKVHKQIQTIKAEELKLVPLQQEPPKVPSLSYGLERVLFNPGVYHLQDPRSRVFNFDPYLQEIMPASEFDFNALKQYMTSSRDKPLLDIALSEKKKYTGSTSSMTSVLSHFHFLLSQWRMVNTNTLSKMFPVEFRTFTAIQRAPVAVFLRWRDGVYAIDADKQFDTSSILSMLGKSMEKLLTLPTEDFELYRKENSDQIPEAQRTGPEEFHYTTMGDFLLRSQLDAHDERLPGTGMFDLKTRAVVSVRMDIDEWQEGQGYQIHGRHGEWQSYEREYYDMIRSAFLKYSLQVRMGRMDGIFVAFHNTERIFGFQYISISEMDHAMHGTEDTTLGDSEFKISLELLNQVLNKATARYPEKSLRLHFETRETEPPFMYIFAEPVEEPVIEAIQATNKKEIDQFEQDVLGLTNGSSSSDQTQSDQEPISGQVEETPNEEEIDEQAFAEELDADVALEGKAALEGDVAPETTTKETGPEEDGEVLEDETVAMEEVPVENQIFDTDQISSDRHDDLDNLEGEVSHIEATDSAEQINAASDAEATQDEEARYLEEEEASTSEEGESTEINSSTSDVEALQDETTQYLEEEEEAASTSEEFESTEINSSASSGEVIQNEETEQLPIGDDFVSEEASATGEEDSDKSRDNMESLSGSSEGEFVDEDAELFNEHAKTANGETDPTIVRKSSRELGKSKPVPKSKQVPKPKEVLAMTLTIRNKVDGDYVKRPQDLTEKSKWEVDFALTEVKEPEKAAKLYNMAQVRRFAQMTKNRVSSGGDSAKRNDFLQEIKNYTKKGKEWKEKQAKVDAEKPIKTLEGGFDGGKKWMGNKSSEN